MDDGCVVGKEEEYFNYVYAGRSEYRALNEEWLPGEPGWDI